ncbi:MAG TPA: hypothetical protein PKN26_02440 [Giesbergeria sp.]|nr:hypothetical protein [Giesbergeria sp.]HNI76724.1 hypothetical protein [Giesbergeria sp.]HNK06836.1 hypothetical protein [Giesbergeria sp.]HNM39518.1 hypothetical protein [Giesbergeria sp.]HNN16912.1 hypothetical protein [Giesbergeria sp.]
MAGALEIALVVEDALSLALMEKTLAHTGRRYVVARTLVERGVGNMRKSVGKYLGASRVLPHVVLVDLDQSACAVQLRQQWGVANLPDSMLFRVAVREAEAWVLADRLGFAEFAGIPPGKVSSAPESLPDPKQELVNLVRRSRNKRLAAEIVPALGSAVPIGPLYNERLCSFVRAHWCVDAAMAAAPSLARTVGRLQTFLK